MTEQEFIISELAKITNRAFLEALHARINGAAVAVASKQDLSVPGWKATPWRHGQEYPVRPGTNAYYCVASHADVNPFQRTKQNFRALGVVVLDDIGPKVDRASVHLTPTYCNETSEGNFQLGFKLREPITDIDVVDRLGRAIIRAGLSDPGANGLSARLVRLPQGWNTKYGQARKCRLTEWRPELAYSLDELIAGLGLTLDPPTQKVEPSKPIVAAQSSVYGRRALEMECGELAGMEPDTGRNTKLNDAAFSAGQLTAGGEIEESEALTALRNAAQACGLNERDAEATIQSGFSAGQRSPRRAPDDGQRAGSAESDKNPQGKPENRPRLRALRRDDLLAAPDVEWVIKGVMPARGVGVLYGPSTVGKSFVEVDKAAHLAEGRDWFGFRTKKRPVVYACLEGQHGFKRRVLAWEAYHGRCYPSGVVFAPDPVDLRSEQDTAALIELAKAEAEPGAVVIIDTLNRAAPGMEENGSVDYGRILASAGRIEQAVEGFVCFVGHPGKNKDAGLRGHSSMFAGLDMVLEVEEVNRAELSFAWITRKVKDGQDGIKRHFRREVVELFEDADGDLVTSCVIVPDPEADQEGKTRSSAMTSREADSLTAFKQAAMEYGEVDAGGRFSSLPLEDWRTHFYQSSTAEKMTVKRSAFNKAKKSLINGGWLFEDVYGNLTLIGPGADVHAEVIAAAIIEKSKANPSEPKRTQSEPGSPADAQKANRTEPRPLRTGSGSLGPGGDFDQEREIGPNQSENLNPGTFEPTGTDGEGWEDI